MKPAISSRPGAVFLDLSSGAFLAMTPAEAAATIAEMVQIEAVQEALKAAGEGCDRVASSRASVLVCTFRTPQKEEKHGL